jgi:hypothetical protein
MSNRKNLSGVDPNEFDEPNNTSQKPKPKRTCPNTPMIPEVTAPAFV